MAFSDPIKYFGNFGHSANCYFMLYKQSIHHQFVCLSGGEKSKQREEKKAMPPLERPAGVAMAMEIV